MDETDEYDDGYLDVRGVAKYLKMSPHSIRQFVHQKRIPFFKVPGSNLVRFSKSHIRKWMLQGLHGAGVVAEEKEEYSGG